MGERMYRTLPDELTEYADVMRMHMKGKGYIVHVEGHQLGFPYTPTMWCKRDLARTFLEVDVSVSESRLRAWLAYCKSCGSDTRLAFCIPEGEHIKEEVQDRLRASKVGLYKVSTERAVELIVAGDLALQVQLPNLSDAPTEVRKLLGGAYEDFDHAKWREGFEAACRVLENEARKYLNKWSKTGRIRLVLKAGAPAKTPQNGRINKMTLGQLAIAFSQIETPNNDDKVLGQSLRQIRKDRVGVVHKRSHLKTEKSLRQNVGKHMWVIQAALLEIYK